MPEQATAPVAAIPEESHPTPEELAALAYSLWQARGCPAGSPDEDWFTAEKTWKEHAAA